MLGNSTIGRNFSYPRTNLPNPNPRPKKDDRLGGLDSPLFVNGKLTSMRELEVEQKRDINNDGWIG